MIAAKGKQVVRFNLKSKKPDSDQIGALILGPTGNLRAPAIRIGRTLYVGFNPAMYAEAFGVAE